MSLQKITYLLYEQEPLSPAVRGERLLRQCAPKLLQLGLEGLQINVHDEHVITPPTAPRMLGPKAFAAQVNLWLSASQLQQRGAYEMILQQAGFVLQGWQAEEWLYTEYGENEWEKQRYWPDGERSPGVLAITIIQRPRYARNLLSTPLTPSTPAYDAIVEEAWPSHEQVINKRKFFNADTQMQLIANMLTMALSVNRFLRMTHITNVMASEYFVKTPAFMRTRMNPTVNLESQSL